MYGFSLLSPTVKTILMQNKSLYFFLFMGCISLLAATLPTVKLPYGFTKGTPEIKSVSALSFGKDGILFIGDSKSATVFAIDTKDNKKIARRVPRD